jgi:hypothetical protein
MPVGGVAIDVGAYLGWYSVALARRAGLGGRVIALEPEAGNFDLLTRAVGAGRFPQIDARQVAAAEYSGWTSLYVATGDRGDHRIVPALEEPAHAHGARRQRRRPPRRRAAPRFPEDLRPGRSRSRCCAAPAARSRASRGCTFSAP